jgi:hypothetical protein
VVGALLLAGCGAPSPGQASTAGDVTASAAPSPELSAALVQYRRDAQRGVVQVKVTNDGPEPVTVRGVELSSATFAEPAVEGKDSRLAPGTTVDLTVDLPEAVCEARDEGPVVVELAVVDASGADRTVALETARGGAGGTTGELTTGTGADVLAEVQAERCAALTVAEHVTLATDPVWVDGGPLADGTPTALGALVATPVPGGEAVTLSVEGATTLFTVTQPVSADVRADGGEVVSLPLRLSVSRCDPHAVAEDKKGYLVPVRASVAGAEPLLVEVAVPVPERGPLQALIDRTC